MFAFCFNRIMELGVYCKLFTLMRSGKHLFVQVFSEINKALLVKKSMSVCGSDKIPQTPTLTPKNNNNNSNNSTYDDDGYDDDDDSDNDSNTKSNCIWLRF